MARMEILQKYLKEMTVSFPSRAVGTAFFHVTCPCNSRFSDEQWKFLSVRDFWLLHPNITCSTIRSLSLLERGNKGKLSEGASEGGAWWRTFRSPAKEVSCTQARCQFPPCPENAPFSPGTDGSDGWLRAWREGKESV